MSGVIRSYHSVEGLKYNRLTIIKDVKSKRYGREKHLVRMVLCKCECGNEVIVRLNNLVYGKPKSCGCLWSEKVKENNSNLQHGKSYTNLFSKWSKMKDRCYNKNCEKYPIYGGRGIIVCEEWNNDFMAFHDWAVKNGYKIGLSLDRFPDVNGNYEPSNCRWATNKEQCNNKRNNLRIEFNGEILTLSQICDKIGMPHKYKTIHNRMFKQGWPIDRAIIF